MFVIFVYLLEINCSEQDIFSGSAMIFHAGYIACINSPGFEYYHISNIHNVLDLKNLKIS